MENLEQKSDSETATGGSDEEEIAEEETWGFEYVPDIEPPLSESFPIIFPSVKVHCVYPDFDRALSDLTNKYIDLFKPEELRGGGLLKYCYLRCIKFKNHPDLKMGEVINHYSNMVCRFLITANTPHSQYHTLKKYLNTHFPVDTSKGIMWLTTLSKIVRESKVHNLRDTKHFIDIVEEVKSQQQHYLKQQQQQQQAYFHGSVPHSQLTNTQHHVPHHRPHQTQRHHNSTSHHHQGGASGGGSIHHGKSSNNNNSNTHYHFPYNNTSNSSNSNASNNNDGHHGHHNTTHTNHHHNHHTHHSNYHHPRGSSSTTNHTNASNMVAGNVSSPNHTPFMYNKKSQSSHDSLTYRQANNIHNHPKRIHNDYHR
eukprot:UN32831